MTLEKSKCSNLKNFIYNSENRQRIKFVTNSQKLILTILTTITFVIFVALGCLVLIYLQTSTANPDPALVAAVQSIPATASPVPSPTATQPLPETATPPQPPLPSLVCSRLKIIKMRSNWCLYQCHCRVQRTASTHLPPVAVDLNQVDNRLTQTCLIV